MYKQGSFEPVARVVQLAEHIEQKRLADIAYETRRFVRIGESEETISQRIADNSKPLINIYHYHCNHLGTPQELTNQDGDVIWLSYDRAWGGSFDTLYKQQFVDNFAISENELQPIKFQGQSLDTETGLHYNRFRYYDSDVGMFISRDPIGLLGGNNVFQYAPNPIGWIDPWGLAKTPNIVRDDLGRPTQWTFDVTPSDLHTGTPTNQATRDFARSLGGKYDDAGHVRASRLGGSGTHTHNIFPQSITVNREKMRKFEEEIADIIEKEGLSGKATITPSYRGGSTRPSKIKYEVIFSDGSKLKKTLPNPKSKCT